MLFSQGLGSAWQLCSEAMIYLCALTLEKYRVHILDCLVSVLLDKKLCRWSRQSKVSHSHQKRTCIYGALPRHPLGNTALFLNRQGHQELSFSCAWQHFGCVSVWRLELKGAAFVTLNLKMKTFQRLWHMNHFWIFDSILVIICLSWICYIWHDQTNKMELAEVWEIHPTRLKSVTLLI